MPLDQKPKQSRYFVDQNAIFGAQFRKDGAATTNPNLGLELLSASPFEMEVLSKLGALQRDVQELKDRPASSLLILGDEVTAEYRALLGGRRGSPS